MPLPNLQSSPHTNHQQTTQGTPQNHMKNAPKCATAHIETTNNKQNNGTPTAHLEL